MKTLFVVYVALVVLAVSACQKADQQATVPTIDSACISNPALCQTGVYNTPGYYPYPTTTNGYGYGYGQPTYPIYGNSGYTNGYVGAGGAFYYLNNASYLCNCPVGYMPTYNDYGGLGCVQQGLVNGSFSAYAYFGWGANNSQWTNIPQVSNQVGYAQTSCYNGVVQSCLIDQPSTCAVGYSCRANSASSRVGLCVSNNSATSGIYGGAVR